jgi:nucleoside-diphosphate-sugar epimerase
VRILVTGAGGFIGGVLARALSKRGGHEVVGLSRSITSAELRQGVKWVQADLVQDTVPDMEIDYVVHCATIQDVGTLSVKEFIDANLAMTEKIARFGKRNGVRGLIFTSSISLHGEIRGVLVDENTGIINPSPYGISKQLCEQLLRGYMGAFPIVAMRLCGVVGPGAVNGFLARMRLKAIADEPVVIYNSDRLFNNIVHTDDLINLILSLFVRGFSGFNAFPVASTNPISIHAAVTELIKAVRSKSEIVDNRLSTESFIVSSEMARSLFQYNPCDVVTNIHKFVNEAA